MNAMFALEKSIRDSGLERTPVELVKTRASQINGCAPGRQAAWRDRTAPPCPIDSWNRIAAGFRAVRGVEDKAAAQ